MDHVMGRLNQRMYQGIYRGKKLGKPMSYSEMRRMQPLFLNVTWKEVLL